MRHTLYECEICGCFHPWDFNGDCREDTYRWNSVENYAQASGINPLDVEVLSMDERVAADLGDDQGTICGYQAFAGLVLALGVFALSHGAFALAISFFAGWR